MPPVARRPCSDLDAIWPNIQIAPGRLSPSSDFFMCLMMLWPMVNRLFEQASANRARLICPGWYARSGRRGHSRHCPPAKFVLAGT
eukprot:365083-Chlamydomonas_euryale.AAC.17